MDKIILKKQIEAIKKLGWKVELNRYGDEIMIENYSPLGENLVEYLDTKDLVGSCKNIYENYDADEHAGMWMEYRGENGVPNSITALVNDANKIKQMYYDLYQKVLCA